MKKLLAITTTILLLITQTAPAKVAAEGINLQISPLPIELTTKPGISTTTNLRVRNGGTQPDKLALHVLKVTEDDNGLVHLTEPTKEDDWVQWISFSKTTFNAPPGEWQTIAMTISPPKTAAFGYYFAVEYTRANPEQPQPGQAVARGAVATFILLNVDVPGAKRDAQVLSFNANHTIYEFLPVSFTTKIRSTGNVHVAPHGNIFITRGKSQIGSIEINAAEGNILPASSRFFSASWDDGFPHYEVKTDGNNQPIVDKHGQSEKTLKWDFSKVNHLRFGRYKASLVMIYNNGQRDVPLEASVSFWVIPWRIIIGGLLIGGFMAIGIWATFKRIKKFIQERRR